MPPLRLLHQLDDENVPVEHNIFDSTPAHEIIEELGHKANSFVARRIAATFPEKAFLRRQAPPNARRLATFADRMTRIGYEFDTSSSESLQNSLFNVKDADLRKVFFSLQHVEWNKVDFTSRAWKPYLSRPCNAPNTSFLGR